MSTGRPITAIVLSADEQTQPRGLASSRTVPHALVARAKLVVWAAQQKSNTEIAEHLHWTKATVGKCRQRLVEHID